MYTKPESIPKIPFDQLKRDPSPYYTKKQSYTGWGAVSSDCREALLPSVERLIVNVYFCTVVAVIFIPMVAVLRISLVHSSRELLISCI